MITTDKDLHFYRALPYTRRCEPAVEPAGDRYWLAWIEELPGCKTDGASEAEAMQHLDDLFDEYITAKLDWGSDIPEPRRVASRTPEPPTLSVRVVAEDPSTGTSVPADPVAVHSNRTALAGAGSC
jgi:predicted RNase H-like HicB family nuclease